MIKSQGWDWKVVKNDFREVWKNPCIESYYLLNRWLSQNKKEFLDLGCGIGRHSILMGENNFHVHAFDISNEAIDKTKEWAEEEELSFDYQIGDMLKLPYEDNSIDCIMCYNVINHTDTEGVKKVIKELYRILNKEGECYLTLPSKETWGFKQNWPMVDENTNLKMVPGPEYKVPHFYADYELIHELFKEFEIVSVRHIGEFYKHDDGMTISYHFHVLIRKA